MLAVKNNGMFYDHGIKHFEERTIVRNEFNRIESFVKQWSDIFLKEIKFKYFGMLS